jgi:nucleotide-binding universal stress UspA family protein
MIKPASPQLPHLQEGPEVLVISTLSTASNNATRRAALIAREQGWTLRVLHVVRDPKQLAAARAAVEQLCDHVRARVGAAVQAEVACGDLLKHVLPRARAANLLVVGSGRENALKEQLAGVGMERLIRLCRIPTLLVKRQVDAAFAQGAAQAGSRGRWTRVLVCVDLEPGAPAAIEAAAGIASGARMEAFHAVGARALPVQAAEGNRQPNSTELGRARSELASLLGPAHRESCATSVGYGQPEDAVLARQRAIGAELVVIGKRQHGLLADFFLGRVTRHVLAHSSADVLVVPKSRDAVASAPREHALG